MAGGMAVMGGVLAGPPPGRSAWAAAKIVWYSGVSGACCPRPAGLVGSHWPTLRPVHWPDQSGNFHCARAGVPRTAAPSPTVNVAESAIVGIEPRQIMFFPPPPIDLIPTPVAPPT